MVGLRDTGMDDKNPYSYPERLNMFRRAFPSQMASEKVRVMLIPDVDEIFYGREPGYKIEQVDLGEKLHKISATKIRNKKK